MGARGLGAVWSAVAQAGRRLRAATRRGAMARELDDEVRFHLELLARDHVAAGMTPEEARAAARRRFGNVTALKEQSHEAWGFGALEALARDVRYGLRSLRKSRSYSLVALLALGLGIGATSAVFSVVDGVLLRPLVYDAPGQLVTLYSAHPRDGTISPSYPDFRDWRARNRSFTDVAFARGEVFALKGAEGRERITGALVSDGFFPLLGVRPALGRVFLAAEERAGAERTVVLSHGAWVRRFGRDPSAVGRTIVLDDGSATVIGVMPVGFAYPAFAEFWTPLAPVAARDVSLNRRDYRVDNRVVARLRPGVTRARAEADMGAAARQLALEYPASNAEWGALLVPVRDEVVDQVRPSLLLLAAAVACVLLIACANVANLSLVRATVRAREMAIRAALGAGRARVIRQLMVESALLALAGGVAGLVLAHWSVRLLMAAAPAQLPRLEEVGVDGRVVVFTAAVALATALLFGVAPALHAARADLVRALKSSGRGSDGGARHARAGLVVGEVALALVLLVAAGLLLKSFQRLRESDLGFDPRGLLTLRVFPPAPRYDAPEAALALYRRLAEEVAAVPGVEQAAFINHLPIGGGIVVTPAAAGRAAAPADSAGSLAYRVAAPGYFETMRVPVRAGRAFTEADMLPSTTAIIVNERAAALLWPNASPLGQRLTVYKQAVQRADFGEPVRGEVVGVVADVRAFGPGTDPLPEVYVPFTRNVWPSAFLAIRAKGDPAAAAAAVRRAVLAVDADVPVSELRAMDELLAGDLAQSRLSMMLVLAFAAAAVVLAATGIYGVIAYAVSRRTQEIGVRVALGARQRDVLRLVVGQGLVLAAAGVGLGLAASFAVTRFMRTLLYEVRTTDPAVFGGIALLLAGVAALASYIPARRAARMDPTTALRAE